MSKSVKNVEKVTSLEELRMELDALVEKRNEYAKNGTATRVTNYDKKIADKVKEYTKEAERVCFDELKGYENPFLEAARILKYDTVRVGDDSDETTDDYKIVKVSDALKTIDPLKLHKKIKGGIGVNKDWEKTLQKLNFLFTARKCIDLGIDPEEVHSSYAMSEEADKITSLLFDYKKYDKNKADELMLQDLQTLVDEMIGTVSVKDGKKTVKVEVKDYLLQWLLDIYCKKSKKELTVICADHRYFRLYMMEICHSVITGKKPGADYKKKK